MLKKGLGPMNGEKRREQIIDTLSKSNTPVSGDALAKQLDVSRQVIVKDIALIRAKGINIFSTTRGYVIERGKEYSRTIKVIHSDDEVETELEAIVGLGGWIRDVFVYHKVYGVIKADMNIHSRRDIKNYMNEIKSGKSSLLKNVTSGYHYHTIYAKDEQTLDLIYDELAHLNFLAKLQEYEPVGFWHK
jgi:transcriptional regulator of NAD metabolism